MDTFQYLEEWKTPGVCLLARAEVRNRGFVGAVANSLMSPSGIWAYVHKDEVVLIDAPFAWEDAEPVLCSIAGFLRKHDLQLKFITTSHLHLDHSAGLCRLLERFDTATFVYPKSWRRHWKRITMDRVKYGLQPKMSKQWERDPHEAYDDILRGDLAGEPVFFIEAPYHSLTDQLVVFRGFTLLPDWHLPTYADERLHLVNAPAAAIAGTLVRLRHFERETGYRIHQSCAVHGDEPLRADFQHRLAVAYDKFATSDQAIC